ncbi:MAG: heavy-metal-associated domain-containing protein [Steroidobacteraceae bacterium]
MAAASRPSFTLEGHWASESDGRSHVVFNAEGIRCANCARSIQRGVGGLPGVLATDVNVVNGRVSVAWQTRELTLGTILGKVAELGFKPVPLVGEAAASERRLERRAALKRIGLAGLVSMQIMMYAGGLYSGAFTGIDPRAAEFLKLTCLLLATWCCSIPAHRSCAARCTTCAIARSAWT